MDNKLKTTKVRYFRGNIIREVITYIYNGKTMGKEEFIYPR